MLCLKASKTVHFIYAVEPWFPIAILLPGILRMHAKLQRSQVQPNNIHLRGNPTLNENGFTHFAYGRCQQGCEPILVNYSRPIVNKFHGFTTFANGVCQSLL